MDTDIGVDRLGRIQMSGMDRVDRMQASGMDRLAADARMDRP